ncbi:MAG: DUF3078 domain-containing protein [Flavobacteriaceae bacterium]|nr:DUF3078 domain-containing protein [Flavobacteriaceae bacterium]
MKKLLVFILLLIAGNVYSQVDVQTSKVRDTSYWYKKNRIGFDISEVAYVNWNAGGVNSISGLLNLNFKRNYKKELLFWDNELSMIYGLNKQQGKIWRKTEDVLAIRSSFGFKKDSISKFFYSAKLNFNTQFYRGYQYPDTDEFISNFLSPGYLLAGAGLSYIDEEKKLSIYASPTTLKSTFVLSQRLANEGAFGVQGARFDDMGNLIQEGKKTYIQLGVLLHAEWEKELWENINLRSRVDLYTDYINDFGNVDVDWETNLDLIVNKYVKATVAAHLRYDNDVKIKKDTNDDGELETLGPRVQFKQLLGIGLVYEY